MRHDTQDKAFELMKKKAVLVADGSGTSAMKPVHPSEAMLMYCYWKDEYQIRWFIIVDMNGRIVFLSQPYPGKYDDAKILQKSGFYTWFNTMFGPDYKIERRGKMYDVVFGGDKGYRTVKRDAGPHESIGKAMLMLTKSAKDAKSNDADQLGADEISDVIAGDDVLIETRFAHWRGIVERVIRKMKALSKFVTGPITLRQSNKLFRALVVVASLVNVQVAQNPNLFATAGEDSEEEESENDGKQ